MDELIFFINRVLISGTVLGSIYALGAIGVTLIFGILRFAHFAHGDMMTLGGFIALRLGTAVGFLGLSRSAHDGFTSHPLRRDSSDLWSNRLTEPWHTVHAKPRPREETSLGRWTPVRTVA